MNASLNYQLGTTHHESRKGIRMPLCSYIRVWKWIEAVSQTPNIKCYLAYLRKFMTEFSRRENIKFYFYSNDASEISVWKHDFFGGKVEGIHHIAEWIVLLYTFPEYLSSFWLYNSIKIVFDSKSKENLSKNKSKLFWNLGIRV